MAAGAFRVPLCFARRHLRPAVSAFHSYALAVSQQSGVFYSDARRDGRDFGVSKNTITAWTRKLERDGWFQRLDPDQRLKRNKLTGTYDSIRYEVLDHDTWANYHPGKCRFRESCYRSQKVGQAPVPNTESPVPTIDSTSPNLGAPPVPESGTKQVLSMKGKEEQKQECGEKPSPLEGAISSLSFEGRSNGNPKPRGEPFDGMVLHITAEADWELRNRFSGLVKNAYGKLGSLARAYADADPILAANPNQDHAAFLDAFLTHRMGDAPKV
jgi:hypothetical protein